MANSFHLKSSCACLSHWVTPEHSCERSGVDSLTEHAHTVALHSSCHVTKVEVEVVLSIITQSVVRWCGPYNEHTTLTVSNTDVIHTEHLVPIIRTAVAWWCEGHWLWCSSDEVLAMGAMFEVELCGLCCLTRVFIPPLVALCSAAVVRKQRINFYLFIHAHAILNSRILS